MAKIIKYTGISMNTKHSIQTSATGRYLETGAGTTSCAMINSTIQGAGKKWTMSFWIQKRRKDTASDTLFSNQVSGGENQTAFTFTAANRLTIAIGNGAGVNENLTTGTLFNNTFHWYNIVITYDQTRGLASKLRCYINGILDIPFSQTGTLTQIMNSVRTYEFGRVGATGNSTTGFFNKNKFILWNVELTASEIWTLWNNGYSLSPLVNTGDYISSSNLRLYFDMEDAVWTSLFTISDSSGLGNGTLTSVGHIQSDYVLISPN